MTTNMLLTPETRRPLPERAAPYWVTVVEGLALGYRRGVRGGKWLVRITDRQNMPARKQEVLALTDDDVEADGVRILSHGQAVNKALARFRGVAPEHWRHQTALRTNLRIKDAVTSYVGWLESNRPRSADRSRQMAMCHILSSNIANVPIVDLTSEQIETWKTRLAESAPMTRAGKRSAGKRLPLNAPQEATIARKSTANRVLALLKAALTHQNGKGQHPITNAEVWSSVKQFSLPHRETGQALEPDEQQRLVEACGPGLRELVKGALLTGARLSELTTLLARHVHLDRQYFQVQIPKGTKEEPIRIPMIGDAVTFFRDLLHGKRPGDHVFLKENGEPWGKNHHHLPFRQALERAGLPHIRFHDLRHTFATHLLKAKVEVHLVARALGHADTRMIEKHYQHLLPDFVGDALRRQAPSFAWMLARRKSKRG